MGGFLDKPITEKKTSTASNEHLRFTSCEMQGWRKYMQDSKLTLLTLEGHPDLSLFGVFDGHGGDEVARYVQKHFVQEFLKRNSLKEKQIGLALKETFIQMDLMLKSKDAIEEQIKYKEETTGETGLKKESLMAGCTAVVVVVSPDKIIVANAGDSRAVLYRDGKTQPLTQDHKPSLQSQKERILKAGAQIIDGRVNGNLNLTRSLGDFSQKSVPKIPFHMQPIICLPQIREIDRNGKQEFMVVACDGIWERFEEDSGPLMTQIKGELSQQKDGKTVLENFFDENISKGGIQPHGRDNMTAILVEFLH